MDTGDDLASTKPPVPTTSSTLPNNIHTLPPQNKTDEITTAAATTITPQQQTAANNHDTAAATTTNSEPLTHTSTTTTAFPNNNTNDNNDNNKNNVHQFNDHHHQQQQQQQQLPSSSSPLRIIICSANIGNAQPDAMSVASWIPNDGDISNIIKNTDYPIRDVDYDDVDGGQHFDIIAIGMQEATFVTDSPVISTGIPKTKSPFVNRAISNADQTLDVIAKGIEKTIANPLLNIGAYKDHSNTLLRRPTNNATVAATMTNPSTRPAGIFGGTEEIHRLIMGRNPSYECPVHFQRGGIRLMILVRDWLVGEVSDVECRAETTGLGKVLANKGGIAVNLTIRNTRMTFVTCHLEAHEGLSHYKARCDNLEWILDGAKLGPSPRRFDVSVRSHHCFIFGDLNFRIVRPEKKKQERRLPPILQPDNNEDTPARPASSSLSSSSSDDDDDDKKKHETAFDTILSHVENENWSCLNDADELSNAMRKGDCLADFRTLPCDFPPTFKVKRGEDDLIYNPKRIPSYTDRIVWKSVDDLESNVKPFIYEPCMSFISSDHKPIRGAFAIYPNQLCTPTTTTNNDISHIIATQPRKFHILVDNIKCTNLTMPRTVIPDITSSTPEIPKCNPFVTLVTTPDTLTMKEKKQHKSTTFLKLFHSTDAKREHKGFPRTRILMKENNPDWGPYEVHLQTHASRRDELVGALLHLTVMNYEPLQEERIIGTVTINLNRDSFASDDGSMRTLSIKDRPVMNNGIVRGRMECSVMAWWLFDQQKGGTKIFGESRRGVFKKNKSLSRRLLNKFGFS